LEGRVWRIEMAMDGDGGDVESGLSIGHKAGHAEAPRGEVKVLQVNGSLVVA
jgi:hypothetical protein